MVFPQIRKLVFFLYPNYWNFCPFEPHSINRHCSLAKIKQSELWGGQLHLVTISRSQQNFSVRIPHPVCTHLMNNNKNDVKEVEPQGQTFRTKSNA